jgi:predicted dehydrogenase
MKELKIGMIGLGGMARFHLSQLKEVPGVRVSALCDVSAEALADVGESFGVPESKRYISAEKLIQDPEVDGVVSVTPNNAHAAILKACIETGKPLFAEKPLTRTFEEAQEVLELYRRKPIPCMINFSYRYLPGFQFAKKFVKEGKLGRINHLFVQYLQGWGGVPYKTPFLWRFDEAVTGTGTLGDLGSHMIDLAEYLNGSPIAELQSMLTTIVPQRPDPRTGESKSVQVDDFACFHAKFEDGAVGVFQTSRNAIGAGNQHEITLYGDLGTLHVSTLNDREVKWTYAKEGDPNSVTETIEVPEEQRLNPWRSFADLVRGEQRQSDGFASLEQGYHNQRVLEAVVRSNRIRSAVRVDNI